MYYCDIVKSISYCRSQSKMLFLTVTLCKELQAQTLQTFYLASKNI